MSDVRLTVRLPLEAAKFLEEQAKQNFTSRNAEIVRAVRERQQNEKSGTTA